MRVYEPHRHASLHALNATALAVIAVSLVAAQAARAQGPAARVVVLASDVQTTAMGELVRVLGAHLSDLHVTVELDAAGAETADVREVIDRLRRADAGAAPVAAVGIVQGRGELLLFVANREVREVKLQPVAEGEGWPAQCDTIAAIVRSALLGWIEEPAQEPPVPQTEPPPSAPPSAPLAHAAPPPPASDGSPRFLLGLGAGYALTVLHPDAPLIHGAFASAEIVAARHLVVQLGARFGGPTRLDVPGEEILFHRLPLSAGAAWRPFTGRIDLRAGAAFTLDLTRLEGSAARDARDDTSLAHAGLTPFVELAVRPVAFLALFVRAAADLYFRSYVYTWHGDTALRYAGAQPWFAAGLSLVAGVD
jgi:hypothetical protein